MPDTRMLLMAGLLPLALVVTIPGCGSDGGSAPVGGQQAALPAPSAGLPGVAELAGQFAAHRGSLTDADILFHGAEFSTYFGSNRVGTQGDLGVYQGNWPDQGGAGDDLAYAIYIAHLDGFDRTPQIHYGWETPPSDYGDAWIGLANWGEGCWDWRRSLDRGWLAYSTFEPYLDASDFVFIMVALACDETCKLEHLQVGPPQVFADITTTPPVSITPAHITASAFGSSVAVGDVTDYEWDWDGDGVYEESTGTSPYSTRDLTSGLGTYPIGVRITTDYGLQDTAETSYELIDGWAHSWGSSATDYVEDVLGYANQAVYAAGRTDYGGTGTDLLLLKYDYRGNYYWARSWQGAATDCAAAVTAVGGGDIILAGYTSSFGAGGLDVLVQRWNSAGELVWSRTWGGSGNDLGLDICLAGGNIYIAGMSSSYGAGSEDLLVLKYNADGDCLWARTWGGGVDDRACALKASYLQFTQDYSIHVAGYTASYGPGWANNSLVYLKYDEDGLLTNARLWPCEADTQNVDLAVSGLGGTTVYLAGQVNDGSALDICLVEYSTTTGPAAVRWGTSGYDYLADLYHLGDAYLVCGRSSGLLPVSSGYLASFSASGGLNGAKAWETESTSGMMGINYLGGNGLFLCGQCKSLTGGFTAVSGDLHTINQDWESVLGTPQQPTGITASPQGTVVALTSGVRDTYAGGNSDCFIAATGAP